jgi:hypothetical protein
MRLRQGIGLGVTDNPLDSRASHALSSRRNHGRCDIDAGDHPVRMHRLGYRRCRQPRAASHVQHPLSRLQVRPLQEQIADCRRRLFELVDSREPLLRSLTGPRRLCCCRFLVAHGVNVRGTLAGALPSEPRCADLQSDGVLGPSWFGVAGWEVELSDEVGAVAEDLNAGDPGLVTVSTPSRMRSGFRPHLGGRPPRVVHWQGSGSSANPPDAKPDEGSGGNSECNATATISQVQASARAAPIPSPFPPIRVLPRSLPAEPASPLPTSNKTVSPVQTRQRPQTVRDPLADL